MKSYFLKSLFWTNWYKNKSYHEELTQSVNEKRMKQTSLKHKHENEMYVETVLTKLVLRNLVQIEPTSYIQSKTSLELNQIDRFSFSLFSAFDIHFEVSEKQRTVTIEMCDWIQNMIQNGVLQRFKADSVDDSNVFSMESL